MAPAELRWSAAWPSAWNPCLNASAARRALAKAAGMGHQSRIILGAAIDDRGAVASGEQITGRLSLPFGGGELAPSDTTGESWEAQPMPTESPVLSREHFFRQRYGRRRLRAVGGRSSRQVRL